MLAKHSQGKQLKLDQSDTWSTMGLMVGAKLSGEVGFVSKLHRVSGISKKLVQVTATAKIERKKEKDRKRKQTEKYKFIQRCITRVQCVAFIVGTSKEVTVRSLLATSQKN